MRELEQRLVNAEKWAKMPKPKIDRKPPTDIEDRSDFTGRMSLMYEMIFLAIQTDSTRLISLAGAGGTKSYHSMALMTVGTNLSHHGKDPAKLEQLAIIEKEEFRLFGELMQKLADTREGIIRCSIKRR